MPTTWSTVRSKPKNVTSGCIEPRNTGCFSSSLDSIAGVAKSGTLYGIGVGPGDVRYLTLRAVGVLRSVDVIGYFAKNGHAGNARTTVAPLLDRGTRELKFEYPVTSEVSSKDACYRDAIADFYGRTADTLTGMLRTGASVGLLSEGDPFFYGSFMHMWRRLERRFSHRGRAGRHRHVGLLDARQRADHLGRRRLDGPFRARSTKRR